MLYLENNPSSLDSSSDRRFVSFLVCKIISSNFSFSSFILSLSSFKLSISASISSVPLKADINHKKRCRQTKRHEAPLDEGEVEV